MIILLSLIVASLADPLTIEQLVSQPIPKEAQALTGQDLVNYVNEKQKFFKADYSSISPSHQMHGIDLKYMVIPKDSERAQEIGYSIHLPERYDARWNYGGCPSLTYVRDQSTCNSCWALAAASAFSDRACIQSKGKIKTIFSETDILSCCGSQCGSGCGGGFPIEAWKYLKREGVCSGGPYKAKGVCKAYPFHPCGRHIGHTYYGECEDSYPTPVCTKSCDAGYWKPYQNDKVFAKSAYNVPNNEKAIMKEILLNGPVEAGFIVHEDFRAYKSGIYVHTAGKQLFGHAVKIIGWGVENGTKYWIIANSWNTYWGEGGFFRMVRGVNNCNIEDIVVAGMIDVKKI